jgi:SAM-dependent MidA family methyltransferase
MSVLTEIITAEINDSGVIPFARFMELALYCPDCGYYENESGTVGRAGDFFTSVSVGPLFGELLALQFADWVGKLPCEKIQIVETGAHDGKLARDVLSWLKRRRPDVFARVEYTVTEPSARRRGWQEKTLAGFGGSVRWLESSTLECVREICGVIFANELLDAMSVHRLGWDAGRRAWFEWGVEINAGRFAWVKMPRSVQTRNLDLLPVELLDVLPDGFTTEICPAADQWWRHAARALKTGRLITLDYGSKNEAGLSPEHPNGSVRAFRRHKICDNILADAGEQDITANVDFQTIQQAGEAAGLSTELFTGQSQFLSGIAGRMMTEGLVTGEWSARKSRELQTLVHPEHLGRAFKVLVQSR